MNPLEYIRRDAEGSDSDTRRRAAADLVKSLTEKFPAEVTQLFTGYVQVGVDAKPKSKDSQTMRKIVMILKETSIFSPEVPQVTTTCALTVRLQ